MVYALCCRPLTIAHLLQDCGFLALFQADLGIFGTQTCHLACLVASLWRPAETLGRSWGTREHNKGHYEVPALIIIFFFADFGTPF